jgi:hypothetical protein
LGALGIIAFRDLGIYALRDLCIWGFFLRENLIRDILVRDKNVVPE